jgi:DNA-binding transcriptional LysR family regulator
VVSVVQVAPERVVHSVSQILTMLWLVSADRGIAFVPASATLLGVPNVAFVPLATPVPEPVELHLLWPRQSHNPALAKTLAVLEPLTHDAPRVSRDAETLLDRHNRPSIP